MCIRDRIYTHEFPPFAGGAGIYSYDLAVGLAELGVEVHVATPGPPRRDESVAWESLIRLPVHYMARWQTEIPWAHYFLLRLYWRHRFDMLLVTERAAQERIAHLQHPWFRYITVVHGTEVLDYFEGTKENRPVTSQETVSYTHLQVLHLKPDDEKSRYLPDSDAIFIDDSFSERKKVAQSRRIPVFDVHMLEALMRY